MPFCHSGADEHHAALTTWIGAERARLPARIDALDAIEVALDRYRETAAESHHTERKDGK
jgi:hypothetical protein